MNAGVLNTSVSISNKKPLRATLRAARRDLGEQEQASAAQGLLAQLLSLDIFLHARRIGLYWANDGEICPSEVVSWCRHHDRQVYLPMVQRQATRNWLLFGEWREGAVLSPNRLGILEPVLDSSEGMTAKDLDLVMLPLVGFDLHGNRLGMGGGFYDTTLADLRTTGLPKPALVGIAHDIQRVPHIDAEPWDIPLPMVVTDCHVYRFGG